MTAFIVLLTLLPFIATEECSNSDDKGQGVSLLQTMSLKVSSTLHVPLPEKEGVPSLFWGYTAKRADDISSISMVESKIHVIHPSAEPYHFNKVIDSGYYAQWKQDEILRPILDQIKGGFFVESGARDGEAHSNTLYYELHGWTGLLVEPSAVEFSQLKQKHRKSYLYNGCLSPTKNIEMLHFSDSADGLSHENPQSSFIVQALPLDTLMHKVNRKTIDFWSLDIEGSEATVLKNVDFDQIEVGVVLIEMNKGEANNHEISSVMHHNGFLDVGKTHYNDGDGQQWLDHIFVNPKYFKRRSLKYPLKLEWSSADWSWSWKDWTL